MYLLDSGCSVDQNLREEICEKTNFSLNCYELAVSHDHVSDMLTYSIDKIDYAS